MRQMSGYSDLAPGKVVAGIEAFKQRHYHILITPPGFLPQDKEWGLGIAQYLGADIKSNDLSYLESIARAAHMRDPETADASVKIFRVSSTAVEYRAILTMKSGAVAQLVKTFVQVAE